MSHHPVPRSFTMRLAVCKESKVKERKKDRCGWDKTATPPIRDFTLLCGHRVVPFWGVCVYGIKAKP